MKIPDNLPPIHPFIFSILPVLLVLKGAMHVVVPETVIPAVFWLEILTISGYVLACVLIRNTAVAALSVSLFFMVCFAFYDIYGGIALLFPAMDRPAVELSSLVVWLLVCSFVFVGVTKKSWKFGTKVFAPPVDSFSRALDPLCLVLLVMNAWPPVSYYLGASDACRKTIDEIQGPYRELAVAFRPSDDLPSLPDVYYVILDGSAHHNTLRDVCGYDNSEFLSRLGRLNATVFDHAASNYFKTAPSVGSSLNMTYLENVPEKASGQPCADYVSMRVLQDNNVFRLFRRLGYRVINITSGQPETEYMDSASENVPTGVVNHFMIALMTLTPLRATESCFPLLRNLYAGRHLAQSAAFEAAVALPGPKLVFYHCELTHPPYLFDEHGSLKPLPLEGMQSNWKTPQEYASQIKFAETRILNWVNAVQGKSKNYILILQADHGPGPFAASAVSDKPARLKFIEDANVRMRVFHAIDAGTAGLPSFGYYDGMTPVNTFRMTLNRLAGLKLEKLEDRSLYPGAADPNFTSVGQGGNLENVSAILRF